MIQTVDNFNLLKIDILKTKKERKEYLSSKKYFCLSDGDVKEFSIRLSDYYNEKCPNNNIFSFFKDQEKKAIQNEDDLIISIQKNKNNQGTDIYFAQTGNYIGKFIWHGLSIDIKSRFSNIFLERMLNFANDIFLDDVSIKGNLSNKDFDVSKYIIYYMFIQNLEKAFLLGLPKAYKDVNYHEMKLKGKININRFIKYDIPFQGKVSSTSREQKEIQEIIDTLYKAVKIIDKNIKDFTKSISHIKTHLKQHRTNKYVSNETINKALKSKALQNPIFASYKKILEYAKFIINGNNIQEKENGTSETYGFLVNVAELFEIYITKLLRNEFPTWNVESPQIELYDNPSMFYQRKIIPDIVMMKDKDVIVFDTKYKRMLFRDRYQYGGDLDRNDFFQINTYMSYYQNQGYNVLAGGLLYPIEKSFEENKYKCYSESWFGNDKIKFIVDGIDLAGNIESENNEVYFQELLNREKEFIRRIRELINEKFEE